MNILYCQIIMNISFVFSDNALVSSLFNVHVPKEQAVVRLVKNDTQEHCFLIFDIDPTKYENNGIEYSHSSEKGEVNISFHIGDLLMTSFESEETNFFAEDLANLLSDLFETYDNTDVKKCLKKVTIDLTLKRENLDEIFANDPDFASMDDLKGKLLEIFDDPENIKNLYDIYIKTNVNNCSLVYILRKWMSVELNISNYENSNNACGADIHFNDVVSLKSALKLHFPSEHGKNKGMIIITLGGLEERQHLLEEFEIKDGYSEWWVTNVPEVVLFFLFLFAGRSW